MILALAIGFIVFTQLQDDLPFQLRNLRSLGGGLVTLALLNVWWLIFSRARWTLRLGGFGGQLLLVGVGAGLFRLKGVSGDLLPIFESRWAKPRPGGTPAPAAGTVTSNAVPSLSTTATQRPDFSQFLGPDRTAILAGPALDPDWAARPPKILWRQPVGAAWSGFVIVGARALTQEQDGENELVTCRDVHTGTLLWKFSDPARYFTPIAGEGPRATPTVVRDRVYALGSTGHLHCLDLATGKAIWTRDIKLLANAKMPEWGYSGSPLVLGDWVIVSAGGGEGKSLLAYLASNGEVAWSGGSAGANYGSPFHATLAGAPQILAFNSGRITSHNSRNGAVLWEYKWGVGMPHVAMPVVTGPDTVLFSSGYGVGSELLKVSAQADGTFAVTNVWVSKKMKAKFANLVVRDGFLYGLDDGILACVDLKDGSQRWKEGRYGHGQGLLVQDLYLLMSEAGELVLLRPTPQGAGQLQTMKIFSAKTWNPIALSGELLIVRNDLEAVCLELALKK